MVERYAAFVYSTAFRRTADHAQAREVTRATFLVLARRARRLPLWTVLAAWLFHVTAVACRKHEGKSRRVRRWRWFTRTPTSGIEPDAVSVTCLSRELDPALERLSAADRNPVLLSLLLNQEASSVAGILRISERSVRKRLKHGLKRLTGRLEKRGVTTDLDALTQPAAVQEFVTPVPKGLVEEILTAVAATPGARPSDTLARRTLRALAWARWRRRVLVGVPCSLMFAAAVLGTAWYIDSLTGHSRLIARFLVWAAKHEGRTVPGLAQPARSWPSDASSPRLNAALVRDAADLYQTTNIWLAHLKFSREQWRAVQPTHIAPLPHFFQPDGTVLLRHPDAQRSGLAGVLGFDFNWASADLEFGRVTFSNIATRIKGNGSYLSSLYGDKRSFKADLNKNTRGQKLGAIDKLTFNNLVNDPSCLSDALAYGFFREAGVPAPRTAYAYLSVSVEAQWERKPLGLYLMVEPVDESFALAHFGHKHTPVFKPVTYELFKHLGDDWPAYEAIYDLKTRATPEQKRRVIEFARLVTFTGETEFAARLEEFLDLDAFARYLACEVLLSNYDGFLSDGQNFYLFLDPRSNKFGFIPWDLDAAWGRFPFVGTTRQREHASLWHPWVGHHRFLERVMEVDVFRRRYRAQLEGLLETAFVPSRLAQRIDALAGIVRSPIAAESDFRLRKFEDAVSDQAMRDPDESPAQGADRPAHQLKRFMVARAQSVREQLDGKSNGVILERGRRK